MILQTMQNITICFHMECSLSCWWFSSTFSHGFPSLPQSFPPLGAILATQQLLKEAMCIYTLCKQFSKGKTFDNNNLHRPVLHIFFVFSFFNYVFPYSVLFLCFLQPYNVKVCAKTKCLGQI